MLPTGNYSLAFYNLKGQKVLTQTIAGSQQVEINDLPIGVYMVSITDISDTTRILKLVKQ